jgi:micrococcal nuclease
VKIYLLLLLILTSCSPSSNLDGPFLVIDVIDGDTLKIDSLEKIRLSGINTPEKKECHYQESKEKLNELVFNKSIYLEKDYTNKGRYGRLLRYIHTKDQDINKFLVLHGYAKVYDKYAYDTKKYKELKELEHIARLQKLGVWTCKETIIN